MKPTNTESTLSDQLTTSLSMQNSQYSAEKGRHLRTLSNNSTLFGSRKAVFGYSLLPRLDISKFWEQSRRIAAGWPLLYSIPGFLCFAPSLCQTGLPVDGARVPHTKDNRDGCVTRKFEDICEICFQLYSR
jgi:hypothetical protein